MIAQTRAEFLKIRTTRTTLGLFLGMVALVLLVALLSGLLSALGGLDDSRDQRELLATGGFASLFALLAGALLVTGEYRFGTIRPTFLVTPRRSKVIEAKLAASMLLGAVFAAVGAALSFAIVFAILAGRDISVSLDGGDIVIVLLKLLGDAALWGGLGVGFATIVRNQVGTVIALLAWLFVVETILISFVPSIGRFAPGQASAAFTGAAGDHQLPVGAAVAVFAAWVVVLVAIGALLTARRDVN